MIAAERGRLKDYAEAFRAFGKLASGRHLPRLRSLREEGFARFSRAGFPTTAVEEWRFTNISAIAKTNFQLPAKDGRLVSEQEIEPYYLEGAACTLVFINGHFSAELSELLGLPEDIVATSLAEQLVAHPETVEPNLGRFLDTTRDSFSALNTAFLEDGAYVQVRQGTVLKAPIHLLLVSVGSQDPLMIHPRNLVLAEPGSEVTVVEEYVSLGGGQMFCNVATEVLAGDGAIVAHYRIQRPTKQTFHISTLRLEQARDASVASHSVLLGGELVRNNVHPVLAGAGGECLVNGLFLGTGREHLDNYMLVEHSSAHCNSRQFYNGILDDQAHGVFHGRIIVQKDAQKTDAKQTNRNLLLSDDAQIDTKPQLEIFADDVKCTHGATIGQIEESALFYLRTRGIDELSARRLLLEAFASECLGRMTPGPARSHIETLILRRIFQIAGKATDRAEVETREAAVERSWEELS